jgi:glycosyltransferase involved in cell wall biosynthesis
MKLVVFIPCLNEEQTLPTVINSIPKKIKGVDKIEILVIDDGSTDKTSAVAKKLGVTRVIRHIGNKGLAYSFRDGIRGSLEMGADIIVLTDGDNQYPQERIPDLIEPILNQTADLVIADRQIDKIAHFTSFKKFLQKFGTWVLNNAAGTDLPDGTSGFRAFSKEAAIDINLITRYSFGMETAIQAGNKRQRIATIKIKTNPKTRESRLMSSDLSHAKKSAVAIMRGYLMYKPYVVFITLGIIMLLVGLVPFVNYLIIFLTTKHPGGAHHIQSLLLGVVFLVASFFSFALALLADLIRINRSLLEDVLEHQRRVEYIKKTKH